MKKRLLALLLMVSLITILLAPATTVSAATRVMDQKLLRMGTPQSVIDRLDEDTKLKISNDKSLTFAGADFLSYDEDARTYDVLTVGNDVGGATTYGQIPDGDMNLTWTYWLQKGADNSMSGIVVTYNYQWNKLPLNRWQDPIGVSWDGSKFQPRDNSFEKTDYFKAIYDPNTYVQSHAYNYANGFGNGVTWYADLHGYQPEAAALFGNGSFVLVPLSTTYTGSITLYGHYVHAKVSVNLALNIGSIGAFSVSGLGDFDELGNQKTISWSW
jgi:hypothetical protein